jgi:hypothetical protein
VEAAVRTPVTTALVNDYDIVVMGIAHILQQYRDRVVIAELDTNVAVSDIVDIVPYDSFGQPDDQDEISVPSESRSTPGPSTRPDRQRPQAAHTRLFVKGVAGARPRRCPRSDPRRRRRHQRPTRSSTQRSGLNWPGRSEGLTDRDTTPRRQRSPAQRTSNGSGGARRVPPPKGSISLSLIGCVVFGWVAP